MAPDTRNLRPRSAPPAIAEALVSRLTPQPHRSYLLGDLAEGYALQLRQSEAEARSWYWRQTLRSMPFLTGLRLRSDGARTLGLVLAVSAAAWVMMDFWELYVARQSASFLASQPDAPSMIVVRSIYFLVQTIGFALAGAGIAKLAFRRQWQFGKNLVYFLGPTLCALVVAAAVAASATQQFGYIALRIGLAAIALTGGAYLAHRYSRI
ncbi:MAG: hypothetical protein AAGE85_08585 [Pseudomonadota bacterium]